jgi:hypothetical protein
MEVGVQTDNIPSKNVAVINIDKKQRAKPKKRKAISPIANAVPDIQQRWRIWEAIDKPNMTRDVEVQEDLMGKLNELFGDKLTPVQEAIKSFQSNVVKGYIGGEPYSQQDLITRMIAGYSGSGSGKYSDDDWMYATGLAGKKDTGQPRTLEEEINAYNKKYSFGASPAEERRLQRQAEGIYSSSDEEYVRKRERETGIPRYRRARTGRSEISEENIIEPTLRPTLSRYVRGATGIPTVGTSTLTGSTVRTGATGISTASTVRAIGTDDDNLTAMINAELNRERARAKAGETLKRFGKSLGQRQIAKNMRDIEKQFRVEDVKSMVAGAKRRERGQGASPLLG